MLVSPPPHCIGCKFREKKPSKKPRSKVWRKGFPPPKMSKVVAEINDHRLNKSWNRLKALVEPLFEPDFEILRDKMIPIDTLGRKQTGDSEWKVPNDVFDYLLECKKVVDILHFNLADEGLYPTNYRLRQMKKVPRRLK